MICVWIIIKITLSTFEINFNFRYFLCNPVWVFPQYWLQPPRLSHICVTTVCPEKVVQHTILSISLTQLVILKFSLCFYIVLLSYFSKISYIAILLVYRPWKANFIIKFLGPFIDLRMVYMITFFKVFFILSNNSWK